MQPKIVESHNLAPALATRAVLHEMACGYAEKLFARKGGLPQTWVLGFGHNAAVVELPFENDLQKRVSVEVMRRMVLSLPFDCYSFMTEAYVAALSKDKLGEAEYRRRVEQSETTGVSSLPPEMRDDVMMVFTHDPKGTVASRYLVNMRPRGPNYLGVRIDEFDEMGWGGRIGNFYLPENYDLKMGQG